MAYQDRPYYRDRPGSTNPLMWLLNGSVPLFTIFDIRVRAHASLIVTIAVVLLFGFGQGSTVEMRVQSMTVLFSVVLLHEFGHCFAARWTGGEANDILMTPLGGMAMASSRRRPLPTAITVAGGPAVNVLLCLLCGFGMFAITGRFPITPWSLTGVPARGWFAAYNYFWWIYVVSFGLLLFNILPVYPLDGGQLLQACLWKPMGYFKSMMLTLNIGLVGSVLMLMVGLATFGSIAGGLLLIFIAAGCLFTCIQMRAMMKAEGPWAFSDEDSMDYGASVYAPAAKRSSARAVAREEKKIANQKRQEAAEQRQIDAILAKVSAHGMQSLSWSEKRTLKKATEHQRERDQVRPSRARRGL